MQPPGAPRYRKLVGTAGRFSPLFSQLITMSLRQMIRRPLRAGATSLGIAMGLGLVVTALFSFDLVEHMNDIAFFRTDRQPVTLTFTDENHGRALQAVERMPGVLRAESYRSVAVRLHNGHLSGQLSIMGKPKDMDLSRVLDLDDRPIELPASGLVIGGPLLAKVTRVESAGLTKVSALGIEEQWVRTILKA